jgi:hypothetical protein
MSAGAGLEIGAASAALSAPSVTIAPTSPAIFFPILSSNRYGRRNAGSLQRWHGAMVPGLSRVDFMLIVGLHTRVIFALFQKLQ